MNNGKPRSWMIWLFSMTFVAALCLLLQPESTAQSVRVSLPAQLGAEANQQSNDSPVSISAAFKLKPGTKQGHLVVTAKIRDGWHTYSVTQKPGGPIPSKLTVAESPQYSVDKFVAQPAPTKKKDTTFDMVVEQHRGQVVWFAPITLKQDVVPEKLAIKVIYNGGACESKDGGMCVPIFDVEKTATFAGYQKVTGPAISEVKLTPFRSRGLRATLTGKVFHPANQPIQAGGQIRLQISVQSDPGCHVYQYGKPESKSLSRTEILFADPAKFKLVGPESSARPEVDTETFGVDDPIYYHKKVSWTFDLVVPQGNSELRGQITLQSCDEKQCDPPVDLGFTIKVPLGKVAGPVSFSNKSPDRKTLKAAKQDGDRPSP